MSKTYIEHESSTISPIVPYQKSATSNDPLISTYSVGEASKSHRVYLKQSEYYSVSYKELLHQGTKHFRAKLIPTRFIMGF